MLELKAECVGSTGSDPTRNSAARMDPLRNSAARLDSCRYSGGRMSNVLLEQKYVEFPKKHVDFSNTVIGSALGRKIFAGQTLQSFEDSLYDLPDENEHWLLGNRFFASTVNVAIVASAIHMGVIHEVDPGVEGPVKELLFGFENFFAAIFTLEMLVKLSIMRHNYFCDRETRGWNVMDFVIGVVSITDCWVLPLILDTGSNSALSIVRIFRLLRLLRILKFLRHVPELIMVMEGMFAAMKAMGWILLLLFGLMYIMSIICVEIIGYAGTEIYPAFNKDSASMEQEVVEDWNNYLYFGTLVRSLVSLLSMMLLSEWSLLVRPVFEKQAPMVILFSCLIFVTTFGIFNVMIGVVVERTNEAMTRERMQNENQRSLNRVGLVKDLAHLMFQQDEDGDGKLSLQEMHGLTRQKRFKELLEMIDLPFGFDVECLFMMFDDNSSGQLSEEHFVLGMLRLLDGSHFQQACIQQLMLARVRRSVLGIRDVIEETVSSEISALRAEMTTLFVALQSSMEAGELVVEDLLPRLAEARVDRVSPEPSSPTPMAAAAAPESRCRTHTRGDAGVELRFTAGLAEIGDGSAETVALQALWKRLGAIVEALEQPIMEMAVLARKTSQQRSGASLDMLTPSACGPGRPSNGRDQCVSRDPAPRVGHRVADVALAPREADDAPAGQGVPAAKPSSSDLSPTRPCLQR